MMTIQVRLFASLRDAAGIEECRLELAPGARGLDAKATLVQQHRRLKGLMESARLAVNQEYQPWETPLHDGDELSLIPPVSGG